MTRDDRELLDDLRRELKRTTDRVTMLELRLQALINGRDVEAGGVGAGGLRVVRSRDEGGRS